MKKTILFSLLLIAAVTSGFANDPHNDDPGIRELFKKEFAGAEDVKWSRENDYDKVSFVLAGRRTVAYYDEDGQLVGCIRNILFDQLPLSVMRTIDRRFINAGVSEVRELSSPEGTSYLLTLDKGNKKYSAKIGADGYISELQRI